MKGEIVDGANDLVLDLDEHVETLWKALDDGLTVEIVWEALHLIELYFALLIIGHMLLAAEYMFINGTNSLDLMNHELVKLKKVTGGFFEEGKSRLCQMFKIYPISGTGTDMYRKLTMNSTKDAGLYGNFILRPDSTSTHPLIPYVTETLTSSYCC